MRPFGSSRTAKAGLTIGLIGGPDDRTGGRRPQVLLATLTMVACLSALAPAAPASATSAPTGGMVTRAGTQLRVDGQPWRFAGYNLPCAQAFLMTDEELGYYLDAAKFGSKANVIRAWFFQSNGGPGNWAGFDRLLKALRVRGMRVIPTLVNDGVGCEPSPTGRSKPVGWYEDGYTQARDGYPLAFRDFAVQVAARYRDDSTIAFWQLVNEAAPQTPTAGDGTVCDDTRSMNALRSFSDAMVTAIRTTGSHHLVNLGTQGSGQCGTSRSAAYKYVHDGLLDLCEYHDYAAADVALTSLLAARIDDCRSLPHGGKPLFVGESGIVGNVQPDGSPQQCDPWPACSGDPVTIQTLSRRASFFQSKLSAASTAGTAGYVVWFKSPFYDPNGDPFAIGTNDPTESAMAAAVAPNAVAPVPVAAISETGFPVLLPVGALIPLAGGVALVVRRRRRSTRTARPSTQ